MQLRVSDHDTFIVVQVEDENDDITAAADDDNDDDERRSAMNDVDVETDDVDGVNEIQQLNGLLNECIILLRSVTSLAILLVVYYCCERFNIPHR